MRSSLSLLSPLVLAAVVFVGGVEDPQPGDSIIAGDIRGKRLKSGGFTFANDARHGFTLTDDRVRRF